MKPPPFAYHAATSLEQVRKLLTRAGEDARLLAGGQSLGPMLNLRLARPALLVDLNPLEKELGGIRCEDGLLRIGALMRQRDVERHPLVRDLCPLLARALRYVGHPTIRNRGTLGGSVAHADPSAEIPCALLALDGQIEALSLQGRRGIPAAEFFRGPFTTDLHSDEVLTAVFLPRHWSSERVSFQEVARRHGDFAIVAVAAGAALTPFEARKYVLGHGRYIDDIILPRLLHASFVRSPYPHAHLRDILLEAARHAPGVVAMLTGRDLAALTAPLRLAPPIPGLAPMEMTTLPMAKVRFVGDLVACVIAENRYLAEDACELVEVDYDPLPAVVDPEHAADPDQPLVDEAVPRNAPYQGGFSYGDVEAAFAGADRIVEASFYQHRQTHAPLETRGCIAHWNPGDDTMTLWSSTQIPHPLRTQLAARLGIPESRARVITPDVGGGFGQKIPLYREELTVAAASRLLGRPVKWIEDRRENLLAACHAREDMVWVQAAVQRDGTMLGVKARILTDFGAYAFFPANYMAQVVGMMLPGPYRFQDYTYEITTVLTNKCPVGPYRAPMLICSWVTEGTVDAVARALELDPVEVRRRNMLHREERQFISATGQRYESLVPRDTLDRAVDLLSYEEFRRWQTHARAEGHLVGLGLCAYVEPNTYGSAFYRQAGIPGSRHDVAIVRIEPSGAITAQIGIASQGQGHLTTVAQVLADEFTVPIDSIRVQAGDTAAAPYGMGTRGSRGGAVSAGSALGAARILKEKLFRLAAHLLEPRAEDLELRDGRMQVRGSPQSGLTLRELAQKPYLAPMELPPGMGAWPGGQLRL